MFLYLAQVSGVLFIACVFISIWLFIARQKVVTAEVIIAAVCGYFLIGFSNGKCSRRPVRCQDGLITRWEGRSLRPSRMNTAQTLLSKAQGGANL